MYLKKIFKINCISTDILIASVLFFFLNYQINYFIKYKEKMRSLQ